jgi:pyridoxal phosphate enzyme (YggS family)
LGAQDGLNDVAERLDLVRRLIAKACADSHRKAADVDLVCIAKNFNADTILPVLKRGHRIFGENRVQEAAGKWPALRQQYPDVELHLVGPLQSNKAELAVEVFDIIETIDRPKIAEAVAHHMHQKNKNLPCFIQVNTGAEKQKSGVAVEDLSALINTCRYDLRLRVEGLMCVPPVDRPVTPHFALLRRLAMEFGLDKLSMGMSGDFEEAIMLGATHVRVGAAIFGAR